MKKKFNLLFIFVLTMFVCVGGVRGAKIDINAVGSDAQKSAACRTDICASTQGISKKVGNQPIDGIRVILKNKSHTTIATKDLWFTTNKASFVGSNNNIENIFNKYKKYNGDIFDYNNFLGKLNEQDVEAILKKINSSYNLDNTKNYYMVVEPIFVLQYAYYHDDTNGAYTFYIKGTPQEVVQTLLNLGSTTAVNNGAKYFVYNDYSNCNDKVGWSTSAGCQNWNVIENYFTTFKLEKTYGKYTKKKSAKVDVMAEQYSTNIFGKGIIQISNYIKKGTLKIVKIDNHGGPVLGAKFNIYKGSGCENANRLYSNKVVPGSLTLTLDPGSYSIKEVSNDSRYYESPSDSCVNVSVVANETTTKTFTNNLNCDGELDYIEANYTGNARKNELIKLYNEENKNGLLNFNNPTCGTVTCNSSKTIGCLSASFTPNTGFSANNLSCLTNTVTYGTNTAVCQTTLSVSSHVGNGPFSAKSGQMYIISSTGKAITMNLAMTCYLYSNSLPATISGGNFSDYLTNVQFDIEGDTKKYLTRGSNPEIILAKDETSNEYTASANVNYYFKKIYSNNGTGVVKEVSKSKTPACSTCKFLGYGKVSKLTDDYEDREIPFKFSLKLNKIADPSFDSFCEVTATPEIIKDNKPRLVFRTVNTQLTDGKNAFLGKSGNVRDAKSNWLGNEDIIVDTNNSYNKTGDGPKYEIRLTPNTIKTIRDYNKDNQYDDYNLACKPTTINGVEDGNNVCVSRYLNFLKNKLKVLEIHNSKIRSCFTGANETSEKCEVGG